MNRDEAAFRIWPVLTLRAKARGKIAYSELSDEIGSKDRRLKWPLGIIQEYCLTEHFPPLTLLVVRKHEGVPSTGFTALEHDELDEGFRAVWAYPWPDDNPFAYANDGTDIETLASELCNHPEKSGEIYVQVKARGNVQRVFRATVLKAYDYRCAICGLSFRECLEAAHIIPWSNATPAQRLNPTNGLCLCANHHRLFDRGLITIDSVGTVVFSDQVDETYGIGDIAVSAGLHGTPAHLPFNSALRPAPQALSYHYEAMGWDKDPWALSV